MKKYRITTGILWLLFVVQAQAQFSNLGGAVHITSGSAIKALDGVVNTIGGTLTVDGILSTPVHLTNTAGATLQGDGQYHIGGDWTNDATFNSGASTVTFDGDQNSTVASGGAAFYKVNLNKTAADLLLADNMNVVNTLDFQAAENYVVLGDFNLQAGDMLGYEASRYVRTTGAGFLLRTVGASPVIFPVGNSAYNPAILTNSGTSDQFRVRVANNVLNGGFSGSAYLTDAVSRSWFVEENIPGGSDLTLSLQWNGNEELTGFDRSMAYISHFDGGSWDNQATSSAGGADPYTLNRTGITTLSPFAVLSGSFQPTVDILGRILWKGDGILGVNNATVTVSGDLNGLTTSDVNGDYSLTLAGNGNLSIVPAKQINLLNGVNAGDALAIQQHLVNINTISDPYIHIAMDVNRSNSISTFDALLIKQALLNNPLALNIFNKSWRFVPKAYPLALPPWGFPEQIDLTGITGNQSDQDFYGVKIGDVIATFANPANFGSGGMTPLVLRVQDHALEAGQELAVTFAADYLQNIAAFQFALQFEPQYLELLEIEPLAALPLNTDNFGLLGVQLGAIQAIWSQANGLDLPGGSELFRLHFKTLKSGALLSAALHLEETILPGLTFNNILKHAPVELRYSPVTAAGAPAETIQLYEAWPNPFVNTTNIRFCLPEACTAQLRVLDANGREVFHTERFFPAGIHLEELKFNDLPAGVLYCELVSPFGILTKKMTKIGK